MKTMQFQEHEVEWTSEKSQRFWDYISNRSADQYFSHRVGDSLLKLVRRRGVDMRGGTVLDFGCGRGDLLEKLAARPLPCEGLDFSLDSVEGVRRRLADYRTFQGVHYASSLPTELPDGAYATLFLVETVEHLLDDDLHPVLTEISRLTEQGGTVIVTTPHQEELASAEVMCPDCGCTFHRWQHVRSWSPGSLTEIMRKHGFERTYCDAVHFARPTLIGHAYVLATKLLRMKMPHLIYIGRKL